MKFKNRYYENKTTYYDAKGVSSEKSVTNSTSDDGIGSYPLFDFVVCFFSFFL